MLQNLTKHIPLTTLLVSYFFICGGLYLIGFWGTFNIDISPFVSLADIPKSFIIPFVFSQGIMIFHSAINVITTADHIDKELEFKRGETNKWKRLIKYILSINFFILLCMSAVLYFHINYKLKPEYWLLSSVAFSTLLTFKFTESDRMKSLFPNYYLRQYLISTFISIPFLSFAIGKSNGLNIYNNSKVKIVSIPKTTSNQAIADSTSSKFLGFLGDKLIISSLDNKKITFINQSSVDSVQLHDFK
jgi:hypothetical protein